MFSTVSVIFLRLGFAITAIVVACTATQAQGLALPVDCRLGETCFVQQLPDMDGGEGVADPFCGVAAYDGHDGTDIRVLSMKEVARGVPVVAMADGVVLRLRDGVPDRLARTAGDRAQVASRECGNGIVVEQNDGLQAQYCHLRQGSIAVREGQAVKRGEPIGQVGASGMAQFPHVHVTIRRDGKPVDPSSGRALTEECREVGSTSGSLWSPDTATAMQQAERQILALGVTDRPVEHAALSVDGPPAPASAGSLALVGWGWVANLRRDDRVSIEVTGPDGAVLGEQTTEPMDRSKADYSLFAGRKGTLKPGLYTVKLQILDGSAVITRRSEALRID